MSRPMTETDARWWLTCLWVASVIVLAAVLFAQNLGNHYGARGSEVWPWFFPAVMPTALLMVGVLVADYRANRRGAQGSPPAGRMFWLVFALSAAYLLVIAATILLPPLLGISALEVMADSTVLLGPLQGLVAAALGAFFSARS